MRIAYFDCFSGASGDMILGACLDAGLELEGLSPEDQEFEVARRFVRFAGEASRQAAAAPPTAPADEVVQAALQRAAQRYAPGLSAGMTRGGRTKGSGRWVRRGRSIVVLDV